MSKSILVTGGAGFLGSHMCDALIGRNDSVTCLDNFSTGSRDNISHLMDLPNFTVIDQNVETPFDVEVDVILNLRHADGSDQACIFQQAYFWWRKKRPRHDNGSGQVVFDVSLGARFS